MNSAGRSPGNRGPPSFFSRRAHLLTTASAQTPYPSPRRKRQVSSIPLCLLFPQSQRLCGSPFAAVVCLRHRAFSEGDCGCCGSLQTMPQHLRALLSSSARLGKYRRFKRRYFSNRLRKPATGSFAAETDGCPARPFSLLRKRNRKRTNEVNEKWQFTIWRRK